MAPAATLLLAALGFLRFSCGEGESHDHRCTCVVELPSFPEPSKAVLGLLEKQLDRCGPEHQTCPACPQCSPTTQMSSLPESSGILSCLASLILGVILGRFSHNVVPVNGKLAKLSMPLDDADSGLRQTHHEHQAEVAKQAEDSRADFLEDSEPAFGSYPNYPSKLEPDPVMEARGRFLPAPGVVEEGETLSCHVEDDVEDEEKLGIIDAGDEEWLELHDVIREHSAVTIFNHTDSTWYVSSKHPHFVRPLHGKHRHPLRQNSLRQPWTQSGSSSSEAPVGPETWRQANSSFASSASKEDRSPNCSSVVECGSPAGNASSHVRRILRRPHSAPSPAYGRANPAVSRTEVQENHIYGRSLMRRQESHQRSASAEIVHLAASEHQTASDLAARSSMEHVAQDASGSAMNSAASSRSMRQVRSSSPPIFEDHEDQCYED